MMEPEVQKGFIFRVINEKPGMNRSTQKWFFHDIAWTFKSV